MQVKPPFRLRREKTRKEKKASNEGKHHRSWRRRRRGRRRRGLNLCAQLDESFFFRVAADVVVVVVDGLSECWLADDWLVLAQQIIPYCRNESGVREGVECGGGK